MPLLGPPPRGNDPLHVFVMAAALVTAAMVGAAIGFLFDWSIGEDTQEEAAQSEEGEGAANGGEDSGAADRADSAE